MSGAYALARIAWPVTWASIRSAAASAPRSWATERPISIAFSPTERSRVRAARAAAARRGV